jgi:large conductance mechanosensitive channel
MGMMKEFREFAARGNVADLAVGVILGAAFGAVVKSAVDDLLMPPLGLVTGGRDFSDKFLLLRAGEAPPPYPTLEAAREAGAVTLNWGVFANQVVSFLLIALAVFVLVRAMNRLRRQEPAAAPTTRPCTFCTLEVPLAATRCPHCTSQLLSD